MNQTNQITFDTAKFTARLNVPVPKTVTLLDYYGRELQFGALTGQSLVVNTSVRNIRKTWDAVRSSIVDREGQDVAQAFEGVVRQDVDLKGSFPSGIILLCHLISWQDKARTNVTLKERYPEWVTSPLSILGFS